MSTRKLALLFALTILTCWLAAPSFADSQARIVRLSQVDGDVQIDRNTGEGYEKAFLNLPITQGTKLRSGSDARAEIEFEDGSTLRITPGTTVEFSELALRDSGARATSLDLRAGTAYLNFKGAKSGQEFSLSFGRERLPLTRPVHLRLELKEAHATLAVFKGEVEVEGASGEVKLEKKHSAIFDLAGANPYTLANNLEPDPYDEWDKQQEKYHEQYSASAANGYSPYAYGSSDLNYYGSFYNIPGFGMMWQPYLVGAGWDPFMNGAWMWYPGSGYMWVSSYPWGWMPYRYGSWTYLSSYGWFWQPGSSWAGWNTAPAITNPPRQFSFPRPPARPGPTLVVNRSTLSASPGIVQNRIQLRGDSAGLGIPRGSVRNLGRVSRQVEGSSAARGGVQSPLSGPVRASQPSPSRISSPRSGPPSRSMPAGGSPSPRMSAPSSRSSAPSSQGSPHR
jgi:FecR protein